VNTSLEQLKDDDTVEHLANQLMESVPLSELTAEHRIHLKEIFSLTVPRDPEKRTSDLYKLVKLLSPGIERRVSPNVMYKPSLKGSELNCKPLLQGRWTHFQCIQISG